MTHSPSFPMRLRRGSILGVLSAAGLLFVLVAWAASPVQDMDVLIPVKTGKPPEGLAILSHPVHDLNVRLRGPRDKLKALSESSLQAYTQPLSNLNGGVHCLTVEKDRLVLPSGITVVEVKPHILVVKLEKKIYRQVPVVVSINGQPKSGFMVGDALPVPAVVALQGPVSLLGPMGKVVTKPVSVQGASGPFTQEIALALPEAIGPLGSQGIVIAHISVVQKIVTRVLENIAVRARRSHLPWVITPTSMNLQVKGPEEMLQFLRGGMESRVYVDLAGLKPGVYVRRAVIDLPVGVKLVSAEPGLFTVTLKER